MRLAQGLAAIAALIGTLTAIQDLAGIDLGIDQLLAPARSPETWEMHSSTIPAA